MNIIKATAIHCEFEFRVLKNYFVSSMADIFLKPFLLVFILCSGLSSFMSQEGQPDFSRNMTFLFPGVIGVLLVNFFVTSMSRFSYEKKWGLYALKIKSGMHPSHYAFATIVYSYLIFSLQLLCALIAMIAIVGTQFIHNISALFFLATFLSLGFWVLLGLLLGQLIQEYKTRDLVTSIFLFPLTYAAPTFYDLLNAPNYMKAIASINPLTYQLNMLRYGFENGSKDFLFVLMFSVMAFLLTTLVLKTGNLGTTEK